MRGSPSRATHPPTEQTHAYDSKMSILAMSQPPTHAAFKRHYGWEDSNRHSDFASRPRTEPEKIALPSIRQAFPEISLRIFPPESNARTPPSTTSPVGGRGSGAISPADYVHSPNQNKRRRLSIGDEAEERSNQVPRLYNGSRDPHPTGRTLSPPTTRPLTESWGGSDRRVSYVQQNEALPPMRSPQTVEVERIESRPALPALPFMNVEQRQPAPVARIVGQLADEGFPRAMLPRQAPSELESGASFRQQNSYAYPTHHPSRGQSLSLGSLHAFDQRPPFPGGEYGSQYQDYVRIGELGAMGGGDNKQRKRRGNLPKETTDKLRAWFMAHLQHPYPTEDEKQDLMRQTGLQMNQISNWFINARRRQLPSMINNARAESDAIAAGRSAEGKVLPSTEPAEYEGRRKGGSGSLSEREGSSFEDDMESVERRRDDNMKRGSV